jgi:ribonuclease HII
LLYVGTDEAGYGPLLGPLVVAAAVYEHPGPRSELPRRGIADSKAVYARGGRAALARTLGAYLGCPAPVRLGDLLERLSVREDPRGPYPWYPEVTDPEASPGAAPPAFSRLYVNPVCEREFNAACAELESKAALLFHETMVVVKRALADAPKVEADVCCDKHGGRNRYAGLLMAALQPSTLVAERESAACSSYRLVVSGRRLAIRFVRRADATDTPVALASMAAKYVRELFMEGLNTFFAGRIRGLRPTAGYHGDGERFLHQVERVLDDLGCPVGAFARSR